MRLSKSATLIIGALTVLPIGLLAYGILSGPLGVTGGVELASGFEAEAFRRLVTLIMALDLWGLALLGFYLTCLFRSGQIRGGRRVGWAVGLILGNWFAMPLFWYLHLWRTPRGGEEKTDALE